jgi:hypothetical protein
MKRYWIGLILLSASWLFGLGFYHHASLFAWAVLVVIGAALFTGAPVPRPTRTESVAAAIALFPAALILPWPYRVAPVLIAFGLVVSVAPIPRRWPEAIGAAGIVSGVILLAQSLAMLAYESITARSHELPAPLAYLLFAITRLLGADATLDGTSLALNTPRVVHRLGMTWELLLDPATFCFLIGGITLLYLTWAGRSAGDRRLSGGRSLAAFVLSVMLWLPIRAALLISFLLHRALRTGYEEPLALITQSWDSWVQLALLLGPVGLAAGLVRPWGAAALGGVRLPAGGGGATGERSSAGREPQLSWRRRTTAAALILAGMFLLTFAWIWDPPGHRKEGRVFVDEYHSSWEPTEKPYDTEWYGQDSGYNYACIYDYCSRFYRMSRLKTALDDTALQDCDVLVVKVPTSPYGADEIAAIERYVKNGGGLLLIGEHTNVFKTGTYINKVAERFRFAFRYDCVFDIDKTFEQLYRPSFVPHPVLQNVPYLDFAVSCSIAPRGGAGRPVIRSRGLKNLPADYHVSNFYPQVENRADMRYGAFIQLWAARFKAGRVAAFTDSTIFSNFSTFEPGKSELMLGMLEWLNHGNPSLDPRLFLVLIGVPLVLGGLVRAPEWRKAFLVILSVGTLGSVSALASTRVVHRLSMPLPKPVRPFTRVVIDQTVSNAPLSKSGFIGTRPDGFGIFERWILRLGYFTSRKSGSDALQGDLLVFLHPNRDVPSEFRAALDRYVRAGGQALILDSPENVGSTADSLLHGFGVSVERSGALGGVLRGPPGWPAVAVTSAYEIKGGEPLFWIEDKPVAARIGHGKGGVTVVGFGSRFTDTNMGVTGDVVPDAALRSVYDLEFHLLKALVSNSK